MILLNHRLIPYFRKYYCEKQTVVRDFKCDINHQNMLLFLELLHVSKSLIELAFLCICNAGGQKTSRKKKFHSLEKNF